MQNLFAQPQPCSETSYLKPTEPEAPCKKQWRVEPLSEKEIQNIVSEKEILEVDSSYIFNAGKGVFTRKKFSKKEIVAEYYGMTFRRNEKTPRENDDYLYESITGDIVISPSLSCTSRFINDAVDLNAVAEECAEDLIDEYECQEKSMFDFFSRERMEKRARTALNDSPPLYEDEEFGLICDYNVDWEEIGKKVYIKAKRDIMHGEELFISYGWRYWLEKLVKMIDQKTNEHYFWDETEPDY